MFRARKFWARQFLIGLLVLAFALVASVSAYADEGAPDDPAPENVRELEERLAELEGEEPPDDNTPIFKLDVSFAGSYATSKLDKVCYPSNPYIYDAAVTMTANGTTYEGMLTGIPSSATSVRTYIFEGLTEIPASATISMVTDATSFIYLEDADQYQYKLSKDSNTAPTSTTITVNKADWFTFENTNLLTLYATADDYGLCSVMIADNLAEIKSSSWVYEHRADYTPNVLTDVIATVSGTTTSSATPVKGVAQFKVPTKWNSSLCNYSKKANTHLELLGVNMYAGSKPYTASIDISVPDGGVSANRYHYNLRACNFKYQDSMSNISMTEGIKPETLGEAETALEITLESDLKGYNTDLITNNLDLSVLGKITDSYISLLGAGTVGEQGTWGVLSAIYDNTYTIPVDAGDYTIQGSDLLDISYKGNLTVKDKSTSKLTVKTAPKYTLEVTSKAGTLDCVVGGMHIDGETKVDFMLEGNKTYRVEDKDSGYVYEIKATDDKPNLKLVLGSTTGAIVDNSKPEGFEDVPNTADNITVVGIIFLGCVALVAGAFVVVFMMNKKAERRNKR